MRVNKNDLVVVLTGPSRGKRTRVLEVSHEEGKVKLEGVAVVKKHVRKSRRNPRGGQLTMEMAIPSSNIQVICPQCDKPTRVGVRYDEDGAKYRVCKKCNADISQISPKKKKITKITKS
ncbi:MAG: 50S ribosomal protein L24 [Planctomycetaceae bacterium]|jgi:large subunit ribosomal protein L24|nr:50S ribosomal protein L24 [Planctomycetaceae bacterium]